MAYANPEDQKAAQRRYYEANRERLIEEARERQAQRRQTPEYRAWLEASRQKRAEYKRRKRAEAGKQVRGPRELIELHAAIRRAGRLPSVAQLMCDQQREHWRKHPEDRAEYAKQASLWRSRLRYMTDESYRLYHRSKAKRRKAQERGSRTVILSPEQLWRRWVEFDHRCAYCCAKADLQVEHVIPISKGGEHHLGNIVPACPTCNYSKRSAPVEQWYRRQSFFSEARWQRIQTALAKGQPAAQQLGLLLG